MTWWGRTGWLIGCALLASILTAVVAVVWLAQASIGVDPPHLYTLVAASFGLIIAVWSGSISFRVSKQAERDRYPFPLPEIDLRSRPVLYLFRVKTTESAQPRIFLLNGITKTTQSITMAQRRFLETMGGAICPPLGLANQLRGIWVRLWIRSGPWGINGVVS